MGDVVDRRGVLQATSDPLHLELGCGSSKRHIDAIGVDALDRPGVDVVGDAVEVLGRLGPGTVRRVSSYHFMEHVSDLEELLRAIDRVLVPGGVVETSVPHWSNAYYWSDPTHVRPFGLYTFSYFCCDTLLKRRVPQYGLQLPWQIVRITPRFTTDPRFPIRRFVRRTLGYGVRRSYRFMEFYEDVLAGMFPCYELEFELEKLATAPRATS